MFIFQVVNSLPYVKHDSFKKGVLNRYEEMISSIDPNRCCCRNYVKKNGVTYKVVSSLAQDDEENEKLMKENEELTESLGLQMDGANDSEDDDEDETYEYKMTDDDADVDRPSVFASTQDYLDDMSEASFEKDQPGLVELIEDDVVENFTIDYVKAKVKVSEGKRVFSIGEKEQIKEECCLFPHAHQDLRELREHGTLLGHMI